MASLQKAEESLLWIATHSVRLAVPLPMFVFQYLLLGPTDLLIVSFRVLYANRL